MSIFAYPVKLKDDGEIVIDDNRALQEIHKVGVWEGVNVMFYEEKPMFIVVGMIDQSLGQIQLCGTFEEAVEAAVKIVKDWQIAELESNDEEIRGYLTNSQECHITDYVSIHEYSVYIGQPE